MPRRRVVISTGYGEQHTAPKPKKKRRPPQAKPPAGARGPVAPKKQRERPLGEKSPEVATVRGPMPRESTRAEQRRLLRHPRVQALLAESDRQRRIEALRARKMKGVLGALQKVAETASAPLRSPEEAAEREEAGLTIKPEGGIGERFVKGGVRFALGTPAFGAAVVKAVGQDTAEIARHPLRRSSGRHSAELAKQMGLGGKETVKHPLRDPFQTALLGAAAYGGGAVAGSRATAARGAIKSGEGVKAAVKRPGHKGGSLLHTPIARETKLTAGHKIARGQRVGGKTVTRLEPDAPGFRPFHRRRTKRLQARLDQPRPEPTWREALAGKKGGVPGKVGQIVERKLQLTPEDVFGREWRAARRFDPVRAQGYEDALAREAQGLSPAELTAMRIVLIEGRRALSHPDEVVSRHVKTHMGYAEQGIKPEMHAAIAEQLASAAKVLREKPKHWLRATGRARMLSRRMEKELIAEGVLTPESARQSRATLAEVYGRRDVKPDTTYRGHHQAPEAQEGASMADTSAIYPDDLYTAPNAEAARIYGHGGPDDIRMDRATTRIIRKMRGKPDAEITVYRAMAAGKGDQILPGDWVTPNRAYAELHANSGNAGERYVVVSRQVRARDLYTEGNSIHEWGWQPPAGADFGINRPPLGSAYFPTGERFVAPPPRGQAAGYAPRPGPTGLGPPSPGRYRQGTLKHRTGEGVKQGVVEDVPGALVSAYHGHQLAKQATDVYREAWAMGKPVKSHPEQIGVRETAKVPGELRDEIARAAREGDENALAAALERLTADQVVRGSEHMQAGRQIEGVRWIDKRTLKDIRDAGVTQGPLMEFLRGINAPVRFGQVYARPAYLVTNYPQNYLLGAYLHGPVRVANAMRVAHAERGTLLDDVRRLAMGITRTESYSLGARKSRSKASRAAQWWTGKISEATDRDFRAAMWNTRARERGYTTKADRIRLATDPALHDDFVAVSRRARKDAVDFDSLAPRERQIAEAWYFYPWTSRSTAWAGRAIAQRPIRSAVVTQGVAATAPQAERELGPHPSWAQGYLRTPAGIINPAYSSPFGTQGELAKDIGEIARGKQTPAEAIGTPGLKLIAGARGGSPRELLGSIGAFGALKRAGVNPEVAGSPLFGKPAKTFPDTGIGEALGPLFAGGFFPKRPDEAEFKRQAYRELPPDQAFGAKMGDLRKTFLEANRAQGVKGLAPELKEQMRLHSLRYGAYRKAGLSTSDDDYQARAFALDLKTLSKMGQATPRQEREWLGWAARHSPDDISKQRAKWTREFFPTDWLNRAAKATGSSVPR